MFWDKKKTIITHSGTFHSDEVFSVATLSLLFGGKVDVVRTRDQKIIKTGDIVVDVGLIYSPKINRFDHHQEGGGGTRENGMPYSSFGLVWKKYGAELTGSKAVADIIDSRLVQPVDMSDNGVETYKPIADDIHPFRLGDMIHSFNVTWQETSRDQDKAFKEAVILAKKILKREIKQEQAQVDAQDKVKKIYKETKDKKLIILEGYLPYESALSKYPEPLFVVLPDMQNGGYWKVKAVRSDFHSYKNRKDFPASWAGKQDKELAKITGVPDATFCHNKRFIAVAKSREGAIKLAELAIQS